MKIANSILLLFGAKLSVLIGGLFVLQPFVIPFDYLLYHLFHQLALHVQLFYFVEVVLQFIELFLKVFQTLYVGVKLLAKLVSVLLKYVHQLIAFL